NTNTPMKNVLVLGAGKIGRMVASLLQGSGDYQVLVMDSHDAYIKETLALSPGAKGVTGRFDDQAAVDKALGGQWAVVSCAPFFCNPMIAERAKAKGVHYLDLTEDVAVTKKVMELAKGAKTAFIPQCGLAPGFITIAANHVIQGMSNLQEVKMRVGALPEFPSNALKYNLTWSTDGLINEYIQPCEAVIDGKVTEVPALEGLEHMKIDGIDFEAAQALWKDPALIEIPARTLDEPRWLVIGQINHRHWSAVITLRGQLIRLISVRRFRPEEVQLYEQF
ncbi:MAG: hypothetical protein EBR71_12890, partial [Planctomycetes bacterium]|nr:hypothetical protein [Planctomycetota bacterium]